MTHHLKFTLEFIKKKKKLIAFKLFKSIKFHLKIGANFRFSRKNQGYAARAGVDFTLQNLLLCPAGAATTHTENRHWNGKSKPN
jgi:hypothetical protein